MNKEIDKALIEFADDVVNASKRELGVKRIGKNKSYGVATRALQKSLSYRFKYGKKGVRSIQLYAKGKPGNYAAFIHFGVNGTLKRRGGGDRRRGGIVRRSHAAGSGCQQRCPDQGGCRRECTTRQSGARFPRPLAEGGGKADVQRCGCHTMLRAVCVHGRGVHGLQDTMPPR